MRVLQIIPGISRSSGGPSRSVQGMVSALNAEGVETWLLTCHNAAEPWFEGVPYFVRRENGREPPEKLYPFIRRNIASIQPDIIHINALWMWSSHVAAKVAREFKIPYVVSPRGMLDPWALRQKWWKKLPAWLFYQWRDLKGAAGFCVTAEAEARHTRAFGFRQPILVSPNGVWFPDQLPERRGGHLPRVALFLSRLHPGKGLLQLAKAWARIHPEEWRMRVVGPDVCNHKGEVLDLLRQLQIEAQWDFVDETDDAGKWKEYRNADLFIHPSVSENFGISIAEALYAELPVIATKGTPWEELNTEHCGWWIDLGVDALESALREAFSQSTECLETMGRIGQMLVKKKYTWEASVKELKSWYSKLCLESQNTVQP